MVRTFICALLFTGIAAGQAPGSPAGPGGQGQGSGQGPGQGPSARGPAVQQAPVPEFAELKAVPHGEIRAIWYDSKALGMQRRMHVYLPPGYERGRARYPVLYLVQGGGQDDTAWPTSGNGGGRAGFVLDNLIAAGQVKPMIVVMPNGQGSGGAAAGGGGGGNRGGGNDNSLAGMNNRLNGAVATRDGFLKDLLGDVIPYVESGFRTLSNRDSRAIAGFSFGGAETLWAITDHLDKFAWAGVFSMGIQGGSSAGAGSIAGSGSHGTQEDFLKSHEAFFADSQKTNRQIRLFWIGVGKDDTTVGSGPKQLADTLAAHEIRHEYHETDGGHTMVNWQAYLRDFASLLFR